ncbi:MAG: diguanylate phosphodiesterase [Proteobacteria bacterium]|nr:diguanylate phosphodiesterase [Pseudomonadota bacterium]
MTTKRLLLFSLLLFLVAACDREPSERPKAQDSTQKCGAAPLVIRLEGGDWGYPSPFAHYPRGPGGFKMALIFDSLLERDEKGLIPWLAEDYTIQENGLVYRFKIRKNVRWQDGKPLTPEDVAFSFKYADRHAATWSYIHESVQEVSADGDTVMVRLKEPLALMLDSLGRTRIIPKHIWEKVERPKEFTTPEATIGCGPYLLTEYSKEHGTYRFQANKDYWGPKPRIDSIEFVPVSEPILAYENGELDMIAVTPDLLPRFTADPANKIVRNPAFWGYRLLLNQKDLELLRDVRVRRALVYAINRSELVEKIERGAGVPGSLGILPPDHIMAVGDIRQYPFDPAAARTLLEEAGLHATGGEALRLLPSGEKVSMELLCSGQEVRMAELLRQWLAEVGIEITIRSVDGKTRDDRVRRQAYQLAIIGHGGWGGDAGYLVSHLVGDVFTQDASPSASGTAGLVNPELLGLLVQQNVEVDPEKRRQLIGEIQRKAAELVPEIPLYYTAGRTMYRPAKYDGWINMFDHHSLQHSKLSYLERTGPAAIRR